MNEAPEKKRGFWRTILTEDNANKLWCIVRILILVTLIVIVALAVRLVETRQAFDLAAFVQALAVYIAAAGCAIFLNGRSEPK